jgi:hypothetical protein
MLILRSMYECVYINLPSCRHIVDVKQNKILFILFVTHSHKNSEQSGSPNNTFINMSHRNEEFSIYLHYENGKGKLFCFQLIFLLRSLCWHINTSV